VCAHTRSSCFQHTIKIEREKTVLVSVATRLIGAAARETYWKKSHLPVKEPDELGDNYTAFCHH
jgi:hypothetical protein